MKYTLFFICLILFISLACWLVNKKKYWINQPVFTYMQNKKSKILTDIENFKTKEYKSSLANIEYKSYSDINTIQQYDVANFFNNYYNDDLLFSDELLRKLLEKYNNRGNNVYDYCFKNRLLVGSLFTKYIEMGIEGKIYKTALVDYGCIIPKYQNKYIFNTLINRIIDKMGQDNVPVAIHKSDDKPLPQEHHLMLEYRILDIRNITKSNNYQFENANENIIDYFNQVSNIFNKNSVYPIFDLKSFTQEFKSELPNCITLINKKPFILINGYFQNYKIKGQVEKIFELRYLLADYVDKNILENMLYQIMKKNKVSKLVYQNMGGNIPITKLFQTKYGHKTYVYLFNYNKTDIEPKDFFINF